MNKDVEQISNQLGKRTVLLPNSTNADCYAVYSKEEYTEPHERLLVEGRGYKHRLYLYKRTNNTNSNRILTFILLNPGSSNHIEQDEQIEKFAKLAEDKYGAIEVFSIFTLRTIDVIDSVSEDAILDAVKCDIGKNDIVLAFGDEIKPTEKYKNITKEDLEKINRVRQIKIDELLSFLKTLNKKNIYTVEFGQNDKLTLSKW